MAARLNKTRRVRNGHKYSKLTGGGMNEFRFPKERVCVCGVWCLHIPAQNKALSGGESGHGHLQTQIGGWWARARALGDLGPLVRFVARTMNHRTS